MAQPKGHFQQLGGSFGQAIKAYFQELSNQLPFSQLNNLSVSPTPYFLLPIFKTAPTGDRPQRRNDFLFPRRPTPDALFSR
jgi:hypothetical protein